MAPNPPTAPEPVAAAGAAPRTRLLMRVADAAEAAAAAAAGVDIVETTRADVVRAAFPGRLRLRLDGEVTEGRLAAAAALGADEVSCVVAGSAAPADAPRPAAPALVARLLLPGTTPEAVARLRGRADAVVFEVAPGERLFDLAGIADLDALAHACRALGLPFGFAGSLEAPDVARLLLLGPDHLGFDAAARRNHRRNAPLDGQALDALRGLLPRSGDPAAPAAATGPVDQVFVRDLVLPLSIGAYRAERDARQRVRFSVEAEVARPMARDVTRPRDMRDVFSYDVIIETIRMLAERTHVAFVETLAERIADALLAEPRLLAVTVTVEKLDVVDGSVGIRIRRRRDP